MVGMISQEGTALPSRVNPCLQVLITGKDCLESQFIRQQEENKDCE